MSRPIGVLIVEDKRTSQVGLWAVLSRFPDFKPPAFAETVREALAHFAPGAERPDLVILDLELPGEPGERLIEELQRRGDPLPTIVVTTGIQDDRRAERVKSLLPSAYLAKPYELDDLLAAIELSRNPG